jgi:hypothetical protein
LRITHISETILSILTKLCPNVPWVILFQSYVRYVWSPKKGPRGGLKWLIILIFKNLLLNEKLKTVIKQCQPNQLNKVVLIQTVKSPHQVGGGRWPWGLSYNAFNLPSHPDHKYIWFKGGDLNH